jgi:hypothetical protein
MRHRRTSPSSVRDGAGAGKRAKPAALALLAVGAPLAVATPASAQQGSAPEPPNGSVEGQGNGSAGAQAGVDPSATSPTNATSAAQSNGDAGASAEPQVGSAGAGVESQAGGNGESSGAGDAGAEAGAGVASQAGGSGESSGGGDAGAQAVAGAGSQASGNGETSSARDTGASVESQAGGNGESSGAGDSGAHAGGNRESSGGGDAGAQAGVSTDSRVGGNAPSGAGASASAPREDDDARADVDAASGSHRGAGSAGARAGGDASERAARGGETEVTESAHGSQSDRGRARGEGDSGERGFTDVKVTPPADRRGRAAARLEVSPALDAAIRAEARAAAREEVRMRWKSLEAGELAARQSAGRARHELQTSSLSALSPREEATVLLRVVETAWREGGPARARAVLDVCFRGESHVSQALLMALQETSEQQDLLEGHGRANAGGGGEAEAQGEVDVGGEAQTPAAAEQPNVGTRPAPGGPAAAGAPAPVAPAPESGVERTVQAPEAENRAGLVRSPTPRASAEQPGRTAGAQAPVTREAGAAAQRRALPFTGGDVPLIMLAGAAALAAGALLRRSARAVR